MTAQTNETAERQALTARLHALGSSLTDADCAEIDLANLRLVTAAVQDQVDFYARMGWRDAAAA